MAALTFTFTASALGPVGHRSGVRAGVQDQQLLWHRVVVAACQRRVWGDGREAQTRCATRLRKRPRNSEGEVARTRPEEKPLHLQSRGNQYLPLMTHTVATGDYHNWSDLPLTESTQRETGNYSAAETQPLPLCCCHSLCMHTVHCLFAYNQNQT